MPFYDKETISEIEFESIPEEFKDIDLELIKIAYGALTTPLVIWDESMTYVYANKAFRQEFNIEDFIPLAGNNHYTIFPNIPIRWVNLHKEIFSTQKAYKCEKDSFRDRNKNVIHIWWRLIPFTHEGNKYLICECGRSKDEIKEKVKKHTGYALGLNIIIVITQVVAYFAEDNESLHKLMEALKNVFEQLMAVPI